MVDAWYSLVLGLYTYILMVCGDIGTCLVEACVGVVEHMI
jgi:hypothetical protein